MEASTVGTGVAPQPLLLPASTTLRDGERLVLGRTLDGARTYLAVRGGFQTEIRLGSRSTERPLGRDEVLPAESSALRTRHLAEAAWSSPASCPIRIIDGPDRHAVLDPEEWRRFVFRVGSRSNRIGLRLESTRFEVAPLPDRLSAPLAPGAIQVAGGQLIILGVAGGTMGGYPHVAHVISADLDRVGQLRPGDQIRFEPVSLAEARELDRAARQVARTLLLRVGSLARDS
jgi:allophanate hydrolase subunit 2